MKRPLHRCKLHWNYLSNPLQEKLNINAGMAYSYAMSIIEIIDPMYKQFPDAYFFLSHTNKILNKNELIKTFCACMYYLDNSEYSAWLDSYIRELQRRFYFNSFISYNNEKQNIEAYIIFFSLNHILKTYKSEFLNIYKHTSPEIKNILTYYFKSFKNNKSNNISNLINFWIKRSESFIKKCDLIANKLDNN